LLDLTPVFDRKATRLTADAKQKISLGRGLVRSDVAAVLFDEPLTVIDPELKWELRPKLKALHRALDLTMIYVTHDQTEALTFADTVVVCMTVASCRAVLRRNCSTSPAYLRWLFHRLARHEYRTGHGGRQRGAHRRSCSFG
jgi:ABC-type molybdate transport system ATPase subunit